MKEFLMAWTGPQFRPTALRVAIIVGSVLFMMNHGNAAVNGKMSRDRWMAAFLTYLVPYTVSIHGQFSAHTKKQTPTPQKSGSAC